MKFFPKKTAISLAALALVVSTSFATDYKVNGEQGAGATTLTINGVSNNKLDLGLHGIAAVWKQNPGLIYGATALQSEDGPKGVQDWVLSYATNSAAFAGARQCMLKRGADWPGTADLKSLKLDDTAKVTCAPITAASGNYQVDVTGDYNLLGIVPVIEFKDGSRAWGSHPFGQSRGKNVKNQTITLLEITRDGANNATAAAPASDGAKKFFQGRFQ